VKLSTAGCARELFRQRSNNNLTGEEERDRIQSVLCQQGNITELTLQILACFEQAAKISFCQIINEGNLPCDVR
jgi:hypothetical protein